MEYWAEVKGQLCYIFLEFARMISVKAACISDATLNLAPTLMQMHNIQLFSLDMDFFIRRAN